MTPLVPTGTPIAVIAPCGAYDPEKLEAGIRIARAHGHDVRPFPGMLAPHRYLAARDEVRLDHRVDPHTSDCFGAVWLARGGYGLTRILDYLPAFSAGKPIIGFSDTTALFSALHRRSFPGPLIHGPVLHSLASTDEASQKQLFDLLSGACSFSFGGEVWRPGTAEGPVVGGNMTLLAALCGTRHQLDARGAILLLEDFAEAPYRIDRMLQQLMSSGVLDGVLGVAFGQFVRCDPPDGAAWTLRDVLLDGLGGFDGPVVGDVPVGHGSQNHAFPWEAHANVDQSGLTIG